MGRAARGTLIQRGSTFGSTDGPGSFTSVAEVRDVNGLAMSADSVDLTHQDSTGGWEESAPGILRSGEVTFDVNLLPGSATQGSTAGLQYDLINRKHRYFRIVYPGSTSSPDRFHGHVTGFAKTAPLEDAQRASVTIKPTGSPTLEST